MTVVKSGQVPLPMVATKLLALTGKQPPRYRALHLLVLNGTIPAEQVNGRWYIAMADLPKIAEQLGLVA